MEDPSVKDIMSTNLVTVNANECLDKVAEVFKYDELIEAGDETKLKSLGKIYVEGKDYPVVDGDILNIRFSV